METKHTKGEWKVSECIPNAILALEGNIEINNGDWSIACVFTDCGYDEEPQANAKLIAAAPELLDALIHTLNELKMSLANQGAVLGMTMEKINEMLESHNIVKKAEQAIKKATK